MTEEQKQLIREKFLKMGMQVSPTNEAMTFEEIADWWFNEIDLAIKQTEERIEKDIQAVIWNEDGSLKSHDVSTIISSVMHYFIPLIRNK